MNMHYAQRQILKLRDSLSTGRFPVGLSRGEGSEGQNDSLNIPHGFLSIS